MILIVVIVICLLVGLIIIRKAERKSRLKLSSSYQIKAYEKSDPQQQNLGVAYSESEIKDKQMILPMGQQLEDEIKHYSNVLKIKPEDLITKAIQNYLATFKIKSKSNNTE